MTNKTTWWMCHWAAMATLAVFANVAIADNWGAWSKDACFKDQRKFTSVLHGIPWGASWETACAKKALPATIHGLPTKAATKHCVNRSTAMWAEVFIDDPSCETKNQAKSKSSDTDKAACAQQTPSGLKWGQPWRRGDCIAPNKRKYSSILQGIPLGQSWESTCRGTPINETIGGTAVCQSAPNNCVNVAGTAMWGEVYVTDTTCQAPDDMKWGKMKRDECIGKGLRKYSAILHGIGKGMDWVTTCKEKTYDFTGVLPKEAKVDNADITAVKPSECKIYLDGVWGEFQVSDKTCGEVTGLRWGTWQEGQCQLMPAALINACDSNDAPAGCAEGRVWVRQYASVLWNIPKDYSWESVCENSAPNPKGKEQDYKLEVPSHPDWVPTKPHACVKATGNEVFNWATLVAGTALSLSSNALVSVAGTGVGLAGPIASLTGADLGAFNIWGIVYVPDAGCSASNQR